MANKDGSKRLKGKKHSCYCPAIPEILKSGVKWNKNKFLVWTEPFLLSGGRLL